MRSSAACLLACMLLVLSGCGSAPVGKSVVTELASDSNATDLDFWHTLSTRPVATNDDAFHGLLIYLDGTDTSSEYATRIATLKQRGMLPKDFNGAADEAVERGTLAVALVKMLDLKCGLTMAIFGASPRYALRELEYRRIYPESSEKQLFSGAEFLGIIGKVEDFKEGDPANVPAKALYVGAPEIAPNSTEGSQAVEEQVTYPAFLSTAANFSLLQPASEPSSKPADMKLPDGPLKMTITDVRGTCQYRVPPEESWKKAEKDTNLSEGAEIRTGVKSAVQLQIRPDQTITIDRLGVMKIDRAALASGKFVTAVSMPYGRTRYDIDASNREYDATVRSPNSTLGIRGTRVSLLDQRPFPPEAVSLTGTAQFRNMRRRVVALGARGEGKVKIVGDKSSAAAFALEEAVVDPTTGVARTNSEQPLIASLLSRGAVFEFDRNLGVPIVSGGTVPQTDAELTPLLPGNLNFVARWGTDVNINLLVSTPDTAQTPGGEVLYPAPGLISSLSGGKVSFDHRGGPHGGIEVTHWDTPAFPTGTYGIAGANQSNVNAKVRIDAFLNGKRYNNENSLQGDILNEINLSSASFVKDAQGNDIPGSYETDVPPGQSIIIFYDVQNADDTVPASSLGQKIKSKPGKPAFMGPVPPPAPKGKKR
jgi:hypothetical protein